MDARGSPKRWYLFILNLKRLGYYKRRNICPRSHDTANPPEWLREHSNLHLHHSKNLRMSHCTFIGGEWSASLPCRFSPGAGYAPEPVWTIRRSEKFLTLLGLELRPLHRPARTSQPRHTFERYLIWTCARLPRILNGVFCYCCLAECQDSCLNWPWPPLKPLPTN
jgi:hypothetical protein